MPVDFKYTLIASTVHYLCADNECTVWQLLPVPQERDFQFQHLQSQVYKTCYKVIVVLWNVGCSHDCAHIFNYMAAILEKSKMVAEEVPQRYAVATDVPFKSFVEVNI